MAQPAILLVEWLAYARLQQAGKTPEAVAGHSLGEFAALAACVHLKVLSLSNNNLSRTVPCP